MAALAVLAVLADRLCAVAHYCGFASKILRDYEVNVTVGIAPACLIGGCVRFRL